MASSQRLRAASHSPEFAEEVLVDTRVLGGVCEL